MSWISLRQHFFHFLLLKIFQHLFNIADTAVT